MDFEITLNDGVVLRSPTTEDAPALVIAYRDNREHLAPWEPERTEPFFTEPGQRTMLDRLLADRAAGLAEPLVLADGARIIGRATLSGIVRGAFQNANLGYWLDARYTGRGLMTAAVGAVIDLARENLQLHRIQAATLPHNAASQAVLRHCGFTEFGLAPQYLRIAGRWQDHRLFQRILE